MFSRNNIILKYLNKNNTNKNDNNINNTDNTNINVNVNNNNNNKNNKNNKNPYFRINKELKIVLLNEQYPNLTFCDLKKMNDHYSSDDGCIYYKHILTNEIYSWNYISKKWL